MQSGVRVNNQLRYDQLVGILISPDPQRRVGAGPVGERSVMCWSNNRTWSQGRSFYHFDKLYDLAQRRLSRPEVRVRLHAERERLAALHASSSTASHRRPVFAEVDLVSSHTPWTRIPRMIDWNDELATARSSRPCRSTASSTTLPSSLGDLDSGLRAAYGHSIEYTLNALVSFVQHYGNKNLVLVVLGDHQPSNIITDKNPTHDVPIRSSLMTRQ